MKRVKKKYELAQGVTVDQQVRFGKPVIKGTRVPVEVILGKLAGGMLIEEVVTEYQVTKKDVLNAIKYATRLVEQEKVFVGI
ncbi:DUF433 domain-containing protein [Candidatus Microgenomates bacterium]|nr:DUF433 domain-containing protein [Candidatus Microgenomates bacterium]